MLLSRRQIIQAGAAAGALALLPLARCSPRSPSPFTAPAPIAAPTIYGYRPRTVPAQPPAPPPIRSSTAAWSPAPAPPSTGTALR